MDGIDVLIGFAFGLCCGVLTFIILLIAHLCRHLPEEDVSGVGAMDADRLRGADLSHDAASAKHGGGA